ncbi:ribonuclease T2 [uncultured Roseobacter sp.]|uniref:ribonuclease T2 n=1 Tax=uncultured Roseobacter sp. TaxID=114847 RepID=UPI002637F113|nr:ribonuclease T2 [uncultured Roseobacter sp.]
MRSLLFWLLTALPLAAQDHRAGEFDYYVLSLSWSPNWCALEGDARGSEQCEARHDHGWILHGLWPQYERGYPEYCRTSVRAPSRRMTAEMSDIMGTSGLAWHQWKKHGTCSGLEAADYYTLSRDAYGRITRPPVFRQLDKVVRLPASVVEEAFLEANPDLSAKGITITCREGHIQEARICLTRDLELRTCGADVRRDCGAANALFTPIR